MQRRQRQHNTGKKMSESTNESHSKLFPRSRQIKSQDLSIAAERQPLSLRADPMHLAENAYRYAMTADRPFAMQPGQADVEPCQVNQTRAENQLRANFVQVDLDSIVNNVKAVRIYRPGLQRFAAVVKADAYGHGAVAVAAHLDALRVVDAFMVALLEEAVKLRKAGVTLPILVTAGIFAGAYHTIIQYGLTPVIGNRVDLHLLSEAAKKHNKQIEVHLEVDVGMARLGVSFDELYELTRKAQRLDNIILGGIMAHPSHAELPDAMTTTLQDATFGYAAKYVGRTEQLQSLNHDEHLELSSSQSSCQSSQCSTPELTMCSSPPSSLPDTQSDESVSCSSSSPSLQHGGKALNRPLIRHFVNSSGIAHIQRSDHWDMARIGLAMYGIQPIPSKPIPHLKQALSWFCDIVAVREVPQGSSVGYDGTWTAQRSSTIATISVGYADGYPRCLSNRGQVLLCGQRAPIVGSVCMDFTMIDVTDIFPRPELGTRVTLLGSGPQDPTVHEVALWAGTIPWEIVSRISSRVPRKHTASSAIIQETRR